MRRGVYALWVLLLFVLGLAAVARKEQRDLVVSDARYYYVYLPSLVLDGDLDFANQMREHWAPDVAVELAAPRTPTGAVANKFPVGAALTLAPAFLLGHGIARAGGAPTDGYSWPYQVTCFAAILALCWWAAVLSDDLLVRGFGLSPRLALAAVLGYWVGSPLLYYSFREPFMAHAVGWFWATSATWLAWRLGVQARTEALSPLYLSLLAFSAAMAIVTRPTNACVVVPVAVHVIAVVIRAGAGRRLLAAAPPALFAGLLPIVVQMWAWHEVFGRWLVYSYGGEGFHWARPRAWETLFSSRHGLFFWSPLLLVAVAGVAWLFRAPREVPRGLLASLVAGFLLLWYCNSCWWCWWFGDACGARAFVEAGALFVVGLAGAAEWVARSRFPLKPGVIAFAGLAVAVNLVLVGLYVLHAVPRGEALLP